MSLKYEKPVLFPLNSASNERGLGRCNPGSGDSGDCRDGNSAGAICQTGTGAAGLCRNFGNAATGGCSQGSGV
jgi:hypothetical protein